MNIDDLSVLCIPSLSSASALQVVATRAWNLTLLKLLMPFPFKLAHIMAHTPSLREQVSVNE